MKAAPGKPEPYVASIQFWDPVKQEPYQDDAYFLLPHEYVEATIDDGVFTIDQWVDLSSQPTLAAKREGWCSRMGIANTDVVAFGLCGDFAPYLTRDSILALLVTSLGELRFERF
eukprot:2509710-Pyramimonas_sp.AAC.1